MSGGASQPSRKASYSRPLTQSLACSAKVTTRRRRRRTGNVHTQKKIANENEIKRRKCKYIHTYQKEKARKIEGDGERESEMEGKRGATDTDSLPMGRILFFSASKSQQ